LRVSISPAPPRSLPVAGGSSCAAAGGGASASASAATAVAAAAPRRLALSMLGECVAVTMPETSKVAPVPAGLHAERALGQENRL